MPQDGQILPYYLHPHVMTVINDNTQFVEQTATPEEPIRTINVFTSSKGRDGVLIPMTTTTDYIEEFGYPNYKLYGQPGYMPYASLRTGRAKSWCMRVMPDDAAYANLVLVAKVKTEAVVGDPTKKQMKVRLEAQQLPNVTSKEDFEALIEMIAETDPDADGYATYPLIGFWSQGRGEYGNAFRIRIVPAVQKDRENAYKNYRIELYELSNVLKRKELHEVTTDANSLEGNESLFINDIINDKENGSKRINVYAVENSFEAIYELFKTEVDPATEFTSSTFDIITGKNKSGDDIEGLVYDTSYQYFVHINQPDGIAFTGGTEGSFAVNTANPSIREEAIDELYIKAFNGDLDRGILSKRRVPAEFILDAAYSDDVKRALISLINKRYDAYGFIDGGILNTLTDAIAWGESMKNLGDRIFSKEFQHFKIRDPFTGKNIPMTVTYMFAYSLPIHFKGVGNHIPFVGVNYTKLTGIIKNSLKPMLDADDTDMKEKLYLLHLNYFQTIAENTYVRGTQGTSQNVWSDLSEENNMHVLLEMKRELETYVSGLIYNFAEAEDRKRFTEDAKRMFNKYINAGKCRSVDIEFGMNKWEEERSILHCFLGVVFKTMAKRGIIEIDINKRV